MGVIAGGLPPGQPGPVDRGVGVLEERGTRLLSNRGVAIHLPISARTVCGAQKVKEMLMAQNFRRDGSLSVVATEMVTLIL